MGALWKAGGDMMLAILNFFYGLTHSYGLAIILLTLVIRLLLHPLNHKQMVSMQRMQKLQPRLKVLQEKFGTDKAKLNEETMKLYKENKVNPAAGCLPLLVQLPILILLFRALMNYDFGSIRFFGIELMGSVLSTLANAVGMASDATVGFVSVITAVAANPAGLANVSVYGGNFVLLIIISFLTWSQQQLTSSGNPQMAMMNWFMPIFLAFICLSLPGGVLLYWGVSSLAGVTQQWFLHRKTELEMKEKPSLFRNKPSKEGDEE